jgi:hypothetical protein
MAIKGVMLPLATLQSRSRGQTLRMSDSPIEDRYRHFLAYSGLRDTPLVRYAYYQGAGVGIDRPALGPKDQEPLGYVTSEGLAALRNLDGCEIKRERDADHVVPVYEHPVLTEAADPEC